MTTDDLRTRAREAAVKYSPAHISEYMGYWKGYMAGFRAHAAQQPSREQIARVMREAGLYRRQADAILALFDGPVS